MYLDATYVNVRDDALGQVVSRAVVVATGITAQGNREVLGVDIGNSEDETFWTRFLAVTRADDVQHGIAGVSLADPYLTQLRVGPRPIPAASETFVRRSPFVRLPSARYWWI